LVGWGEQLIPLSYHKLLSMSTQLRSQLCRQAFGSFKAI